MDRLRAAMGGVLLAVGVWIILTRLDPAFGTVFLLMGGGLSAVGLMARDGSWRRGPNVSLRQQMLFQQQMLMQEQTTMMQNRNLTHPNVGAPPPRVR